MATVTGRISSSGASPMPNAVVVLRRYDNSESLGELLSDGYSVVSLDAGGYFSLQLTAGRFLLTVRDTSDVIDITVPSNTGTFIISDILTIGSTISIDQSSVDMGQL